MIRNTNFIISYIFKFKFLWERQWIKKEKTKTVKYNLMTNPVKSKRWKENHLNKPLLKNNLIKFKYLKIKTMNNMKLKIKVVTQF